MLYRYSGRDKTAEESRKFVVKMTFIYWGIFLLYLGFWFFVWRMTVDYEMM